MQQEPSCSLNLDRFCGATLINVRRKNTTLGAECGPAMSQNKSISRDLLPGADAKQLSASIPLASASGLLLETPA